MNIFRLIRSQTVFNYLAEATILIIKFDGIFQNSQLQSIWPHYMNAIRVAGQNIEKFNGRSTKFTPDNLNGLKNIFIKIEYLLSGNLFQVIVRGLIVHIE